MGIGGRPASVEEGAWGVVVLVLVLLVLLVLVGCPGNGKTCRSGERVHSGSGCVELLGSWDWSWGGGGDGAQAAEVAVVSQWGSQRFRSREDGRRVQG